MARRNTRTGGVLERMVIPALEEGGYACQAQAKIGQRMGCGAHFVDVIAVKDDRSFLVSVKWQQVSGTAEQKVPFEVICLAEALESGQYEKAYIVLGGEGWKLRTFYVGGGLKAYIPRADKVHITTLEAFVARANNGAL
jgi:hypothetical protein